MLTALRNNERVDPYPGEHAQCPSCLGAVNAKCGELVIWHWAHLTSEDCDPWSEPDSEWRRAWQAEVPPANREVVMKPHRADIVTDDGAIVQLQHSSISVAEIRERQDFYGPELVWIFDAVEAGADHRISGTNRREGYVFRWKHPRKSISACRPGSVLLDLGYRMLHIEDIKFEPGEPTYGRGQILSREDVARTLRAKSRTW